MEIQIDNKTNCVYDLHSLARNVSRLKGNLIGFLYGLLRLERSESLAEALAIKGASGGTIDLVNNSSKGRSQ